MRKHFLFFCILIFTGSAFSQGLLDSCFTSTAPGTSFTNSADLGSLNADLLDFNGTNWTGGFPGANITLPPPNNNMCRAIWIGSATTWTTGGEGFALRLDAPLVMGTSYSFTFMYVSHGTGSTGTFAPSFQTNTAPNLAGAFNVGNLPAVGGAWTTNTFTFTATAAQNGDDWIIIHNGPSGSSGMFLSFCPGCAIPATCSVDLGNDSTLCTGDSLTLYATFNGANYLWSDNSTLDTLTVFNTGIYWAEISVNGCIARDSINVTFNTPAVFSLANDTAICPLTTLTLDPQIAAASYLWQDNSTNPTFTASGPGLYWVEIDDGICPSRDSITITLNPPPQTNLGNDTTICLGDTILLDVSYPASNYLWSDNSTGPTLQVFSAGTYWGEASHACGVSRDTIVIATDVVPTIDLGADTTICKGDILILDATAPNVNYFWHDLSQNPTFNVTNTGLHQVLLNHQCGIFVDSIFVTIDSIPQIDLGPDVSACEGDVFTLDASVPGNPTYLWHDGSANPVFSVSNSGVYSVTVSDYCGSDQDTVTFTYNSYPNIDLGPDTVICLGREYRLDAFTQGATYLWQDGSTLPSFTATTGGLFHVTVTNGVCPDSDSVIILADSLPPVALGPDRFLCDGEIVNLDATVPGEASYIWQDSSRFAQYPVQESGIYFVDVRNRCGRVRDSVVIQASITPVADIGRSELICGNGDDQVVRDVTIPADDATYLWNDGSTSPVKIIRETGSYIVTIETGCGVDTDSVWLGFSLYPLAEIGSDTTLCVEDFPIVLSAEEERQGEYTWQDGSSEKSYTVFEPGFYTLQVANNCGVASDSMLVTSRDCRCNVFVPTGFTPDFDAVNDLMEIGYQCAFQSFSLRIYNRWGQEVFATNNPDTPWDGFTKGKAAPEGVYVWVLQYEYLARGWSIPNTETGTVTIIRY